MPSARCFKPCCQWYREAAGPGDVQEEPGSPMLPKGMPEASKPGPQIHSQGEYWGQNDVAGDTGHAKSRAGQTHCGTRARTQDKSQPPSCPGRLIIATNPTGSSQPAQSFEYTKNLFPFCSSFSDNVQIFNQGQGRPRPWAPALSPAPAAAGGCWQKCQHHPDEH